MSFSARRLVPILAFGVLVLSGCEIPDRAPTRETEAGVPPGIDAAVDAGTDVRRDVSVSDAPTDTSAVPDAPRDGAASDITTADVTTADVTTPPRDAPIDSGSSCTPGEECVPANTCHQGESVCSAAGARTCRDTQRNQANGTPCDKGVCLDGVCQACAAGTMCEVPGQPCRSGKIECATGAPVCVASGNKANGISCGMGMVCQEGTCKSCVTGEACTPANACHTGKLDCSGASPTCNDTGMNAPTGASCGTDKVCSAAGTCGDCAANSTCMVASNPCRTGTTSCNTGAPVCVESGNTTNGTSCGADKVCSGGACVSCMVGLSCVPADPCHTGTTVCSPMVGCVDTGMNATDGTTCGMDKVCSMGTCATCVAGATCPTGNACKKGTTSCSTGTSKCVESGDQSDGTACGTNQVCSKGVCGMCIQGDPCVPTDTCHKGTLDCKSGTAVCVDSGTAQTNGTNCGTKRFCYGGMCSDCDQGGVCSPTNTCKNGAYSCTTGQPVCTETGNKMPGETCGMGKVCNSAGGCDVCNEGGTCTPTNKCHVGKLSCASGTAVCTDTGQNTSNGANCGTKFSCYNGMCSECRDGTTCTLSNAPCKTATYACTTGQEVCTESGNKSPGISCGAGQTCTAGKVTAAAVCNASGQCPTPAVTSCTTGACNGTSCLECGSGETVCGGKCCAAGNGCCTNQCVPLTTTTNCGSCGNNCGSGELCNSSRVCELQTWCASRTKPSGVASSDYQCVDFDKGMPPTNVWVPSIQEMSTLRLTNVALSVPNGLEAVSFANQTFGNEALLRWTTGPTTTKLKKVTVSAAVNPGLFQRLDADYQVLCANMSAGFASSACIVISSSEGLVLRWRFYNGSGYVSGECAANGSLANEQWTNAEVHLDPVTGLTQAVIGGTTTNCQASDVPLEDTVGFAELGLSRDGPATIGLTMRYDNVEVAVRR